MHVNSIKELNNTGKLLCRKSIDGLHFWGEKIPLKHNRHQQSLNPINELRHCNGMKEADPILIQLQAGPGVRKLVETSIILSNSDDPQQSNHAVSFMDAAIREIGDSGKLQTHNMGSRQKDSFSSTHNDGNYPLVGKPTKDDLHL